MDAALAAAIAATPAAAATANLYAANLASLPGAPIENLAEAAATLPSYLLAGGGLSADPIALCAAAWIGNTFLDTFLRESAPPI